MARPTVSATLERLYARLPEKYREHDEALDWPLLKYLSGVVDQAGEVEVLIDAIIAGHLGDPVEAEVSWLPWLGQTVGVRIDPYLAEAEARDAIADPSAGYLGGNKTGIRTAARSVLSGTKYAVVYDHSNSLGTRGTDPWHDVLIVTRQSETPTPAEVLAVIARKNAKPAGVELFHGMYEASWDAVEAEFPTWADWEAAGSWDAIQDAGL